MEYYPIYEKNEDTGALEIKTVKFKVFSGSTLLGESENCYVRDSGAVVRNGIVDYVYILGLKAPASTMEIDNVGMYYSQEIEYEEE